MTKFGKSGKSDYHMSATNKHTGKIRYNPFCFFTALLSCSSLCPFDEEIGRCSG
jgi:hypothetical protein